MPSVPVNRTKPRTEVHYDLYGPLKPSIGGRILVSHFVKPTTSKSDVFFIKRKSQIKDLSIRYISTVEKRFSEKGTKFAT